MVDTSYVDDLEGERSILFAKCVSKAKIQLQEGLKINTQTQKSPWMQLHLKQKDEYIVQPPFQH